jgi:transposase
LVIRAGIAAALCERGTLGGATNGNENELFQAALGLLPPWQVERCSFDEAVGRLDIYLDFPRGSIFSCPVCQAANCKAYDTDRLIWRHLNFFQHQAFLHARTPRVKCSQCGIHRVAVPWARPDSGFTLLFEALVMMLAKSMPILAVGRVVGEHDTLVWRIVTHYVDAARAQADHSKVIQVGMDETASRRGQRYVSLFVDLPDIIVTFVTPGKDAATVAAFAADLQVHGGDPMAVTEVSVDMSKAFAKGIAASLPNAEVTFDKFHVISLVNNAVDEVRRLECKHHPELVGSRYVWLKNPENLTAAQWDKFDALDIVNSHLKTARAYQIRLAFQDLFQQPAAKAKSFLDAWYFWATHSRIPAIIDVAKTIRRHQSGILRWFTSGINNGILEGINSLVQAAKAKARGYRSDRNLATIIYLIAGKLDLSRLPT